MPWRQMVFDEVYLQLWDQIVDEARSEREADALWQLLRLTPGARVLDAPCGSGRLSRPLAWRGAHVVGVDQSRPMLAAALAEGSLGLACEYRLADLRTPLAETDFDAAFNVFSSLGWGDEDEDQLVLLNLARAVRPGGLVFVETTHRDAVVVQLAAGATLTGRLPDGTEIVERRSFDPITGRMDLLWSWSGGPRGAGEKRASSRTYAATELVRMLTATGLRLVSAHDGCSLAPFVGPQGPGRRLGLLAERPR